MVATEPSTRIEVVVVGASAGGVEALKELAAELPADLGCPVVVVLHVAAQGTSFLSQILSRAGPLPAHAVVDGEALQPARVYVAPPDRHVIVERGRLRLSGAPRENGVRPSVDPALRSAAQAYGTGAVGIVLSGTGTDGTAGLAAVRAAGGRGLVQDPEEARYRGMPEHALAGGAVDGVLTVAAIAAWLARAAQAPADGGPAGAHAR